MQWEQQPAAHLGRADQAETASASRQEECQPRKAWPGGLQLGTAPVQFSLGEPRPHVVPWKSLEGTMPGEKRLGAVAADQTGSQDMYVWRLNRNLSPAQEI